MKNNLERKPREEVDSSMGGQLEAKGMYPKLVVDNTLMSDHDKKQEDTDTRAALLREAHKRLMLGEKRARKEIAEAISARSVWVENIANIESLLKKTGSKGNKRLEALLSQAKDHLHVLDTTFPHETSSIDYDEKVFNSIVAKFKDYEHARRAETIATIKNNANKGPLGDVIRAQNEARALHEEITTLAKQGEQIIESKEPNPVRDESITPYSNKEALEAKEVFARSKGRNAPGVFGHTQATESMQKEMNVLSAEKTSAENIPTLETESITTALEVVPHMELVPMHETIVEAPLLKQKSETPAVNALKVSERKQQPALTKGALVALKNADEFGMPTFVSDHLRSTAKANRVNVHKGDTAKDILDKLRVKIDPDLKPPEPTEQTHHNKKPKTHREKQETKHKNMKFEQQPTIEPTAEQKPVKTGELFEHVDTRAKEVAARQVELAGKTDRASEEEKVELEKEAESLKKRRADLSAGEHFTHVDARLKEVVARQAELNGKTDASSVEERKELEREALSLDDELTKEWDTSLRSAYEATVARHAEKNKGKTETANIVAEEKPETPVDTQATPEEAAAEIKQTPEQLELFEKTDGNAPRPDEKVEAPEEVVKKEFEALPPADKEKVGLGLNNIGHYVEEKKNRFFAGAFDSACKLLEEKGLLKKSEYTADGEKRTQAGTLDRWLSSFSENMTKNADASHKKMEEATKTSMSQLTSIGSVTGNALKYGRALTDLFGVTAVASPLRYVMMGGMFFGAGVAAAKEARFKNEEVLEKTRVQDINAAAEEAWNIYEKAKAGKESISKEDLEKAYLDNVPQDLLNRLKKDAEPGTSSSMLQKILRQDIEQSVESISGKLEKIKNDETLDPLDKKIAREKLLQKYEQHIKDMDRAVGQFGEVDALAFGAKYGETAAKAVVAGLMVETAALAIDKLWEKIPSLFHNASEFWAEVAYDKLHPVDHAAEAIAKANYTKAFEVAKMHAEEKMGQANLKSLKNIVAPMSMETSEKTLELATIHKGEGIEHSFIRQLMNKPEDFGYKGDTTDTHAVKAWAGGEAHRIAIKTGYVDLATGKETGVGTSGINKIAYVLEKDASGNLKIEEQLKGVDDKFHVEESGSSTKNTYEYERSTTDVTDSSEPNISTETPARTMSTGETMSYYKTPEAIPPQMSSSEADAMMNKASSDISKIEDKFFGAHEQVHSLQVTAQLEAYATRTLNDDLNTLLGSKGFLGFGRESGINSINWKDPQVGFGNKTVNEIMNAHPKAFPTDGARHFGIEDYNATTRMQGYITNIRRIIGISPDVNEKVADFVRRAAMVTAKLPR